MVKIIKMVKIMYILPQFLKLVGKSSYRLVKMSTL